MSQRYRALSIFGPQQEVLGLAYFHREDGLLHRIRFPCPDDQRHPRLVELLQRDPPADLEAVRSLARNMGWRVEASERDVSSEDLTFQAAAPAAPLPVCACVFRVMSSGKPVTWCGRELEGMLKGKEWVFTSIAVALADRQGRIDLPMVCASCLNGLSFRIQELQLVDLKESGGADA